MKRVRERGERREEGRRREGKQESMSLQLPPVRNPVQLQSSSYRFTYVNTNIGTMTFAVTGPTVSIQSV